MAQAGLEAIEVMGVKVKGKEKASQEHQDPVGPKLRVPQEGSHLPAKEEAVLEEEVYPGQEHEKRAQPLGQGCVGGEALGVGAKPAGGDGGEGVGQGLKGRHPRKPVSQKGHPREGHVDPEHRLGGVAKPGGEPLLLHPGALGKKGLAARHLELGEDHQKEHHDPDPPHPLGKAPPEEKAFPKKAKVLEGGGPGGGKPGHGLKKGIQVGHPPRDPVGHGPQGRHQDPEEGHGGEDLGPLGLGLGMA